jgi:hypothetical protein
MLDQLIAAVSQRTGMPPDKARAAVDAVISELKTHLPPPIASHIDAVLSGAAPGGMMGEVESQVEGMLSGMLKSRP